MCVLVALPGAFISLPAHTRQVACETELKQQAPAACCLHAAMGRHGAGSSMPATCDSLHCACTLLALLNSRLLSGLVDRDSSRDAWHLLWVTYRCQLSVDCRMLRTALGTVCGCVHDACLVLHTTPQHLAEDCDWLLGPPPHAAHSCVCVVHPAHCVCSWCIKHIVCVLHPTHALLLRGCRLPALSTHCLWLQRPAYMEQCMPWRPCIACTPVPRHPHRSPCAAALRRPATSLGCCDSPTRCCIWHEVGARVASLLRPLAC